MSFSSTEDSEPLTQKGLADGKHLAGCISRLLQERNLTVKSIYSAKSSRAESTAMMIAERFGVKVCTYESLRSVKSEFAGMPEIEIAKTNPNFHFQLALYRNGLFNSYELDRPKGSENLADFETRVKRSILEIINIPNETLKVIVLHRAPITATLIYFAREYYGYPKDFYGYVPIELGCLSWLERNNSNKWKIVKVNIKPEELLLPS